MTLPSRKLQRKRYHNYFKKNSYFITINTYRGRHIFGKINEGRLILNDIGRMVEEKFLNISNTRGILIDTHIIMPNHIHAIINVEDSEKWADEDSAAALYVTVPPPKGQTKPIRISLLSHAIRCFKTITTKLYIDGVKSGAYPPLNKKLWHKSFHDAIIYDQENYQRIRSYIIHNPQNYKR